MSVDIPTLETERLILREPRITDLGAFSAFYAEERSRFVGGPMARNEVFAQLLHMAGHWQLRGYGLWVVTRRSTGEPIGHAGILHHLDWPEPELAYTIFARWEGQGFAFEAAAAARDAAARRFDIAAPISLIAPDNDRSIRLAQRLGARFETETTIRGTHVHVYRHPDAAQAA